MNEDEGNQQNLEEQQMSNMSPTIGKLTEAMAKAQGEMTGASKDSENPFFKSRYADLAAVIDACRDQLSKNDIAVFQTNEPCREGIIVITTLAHKSGEWIKSEIFIKPVKNDPQGFGSAMTYARRYALAAMVNVAQVDDDANAASKQPTVKMATKVKNAVVEQSIDCLANGDGHGLKEVWADFDVDEKGVLWALFNSEQRSSMKVLLTEK